MRRECEKTLRRISLLTHPDRLAHNGDYVRMTREQQEYLHEMFQRGRAIKDEELGSRPEQVGWGHRSLASLEKILSNVEEIYSVAGLDVDVEMSIQGNTLSEKIDFLCRDNSLVEEEIREAGIHLMELLDDPEVREKSRQISFPEQHAKIREAMVEQAEVYLHEVEQAEVELNKVA